MDNRKVRNDSPAGNVSEQGGLKKPGGVLSNRPGAPPNYHKGMGPATRGVGPQRQHPQVLMPIR